MLLNTAGSEQVDAVSPGAFAYSAVAAYRTSGTSERAAPVLLGDRGRIALPARSIATLTFGP